jgi:Predicted nucleotidyltransferases
MGQQDTDMELTFEELCELVDPIARKHGMIRLYLFGSRAKNESRPNSDYDFCLVAPKEHGLMKISSFLYDLQEALKAKVDIICKEDLQTKPDLIEEVLCDRRIIFEA